MFLWYVTLVWIIEKLQAPFIFFLLLTFGYIMYLAKRR